MPKAVATTTTTHSLPLTVRGGRSVTSRSSYGVAPAKWAVGSGIAAAGNFSSAATLRREISTRGIPACSPPTCPVRWGQRRREPGWRRRFGKQLPRRRRLNQQRAASEPWAGRGRRIFCLRQRRARALGFFGVPGGSGCGAAVGGERLRRLKRRLQGRLHDARRLRRLRGKPAGRLLVWGVWRNEPAASVAKFGTLIPEWVGTAQFMQRRFGQVSLKREPSRLDRPRIPAAQPEA